MKIVIAIRTCANWSRWLFQNSDFDIRQRTLPDAL